MSDPSQWAREKRAAITEDAYELPPEIDRTAPSMARIYDYLLGGKDNFEVDRQAVELIVREIGTEVIDLARVNRSFLRRAVRYLAEEAGIDQFVDVGSGLPTTENVHQVAQLYRPGARVVYVDNDPIVLAHCRALLADTETTTVIHADAADADSILDHPETRRLIDFDRPWALVMVAVLHDVPDASDPVGVVGRFKERMVSGSYFASCNALSDDHEMAEKLAALMQRYATTMFIRPWPVHRAYFEGLEPVEPGLVYAADWRPPPYGKDRDNPWMTLLVGGVGRKP